jgi:hypothetical protein
MGAVKQIKCFFLASPLSQLDEMNRKGRKHIRGQFQQHFTCGFFCT